MVKSVKKIEKEEANTSKNDYKNREKTINFTDEVKKFISPSHVSTNPYELESASGDLTSIAFYHYKFRKKYLASHIVRPADTEELSHLIKICRDNSIPVTIRAAGTSCFSSATPTKGGAIIDVRRLNKINNIDLDKMTVKCGAGISWLNLIEHLVDYGLAPKCYPTSFKTSCVCGFIATPGTAGIGVPKYGSMKESIISLVLVQPDGKIIEISRDSKGEIALDDIIGTCGIYGAIAEVELSLTTLKTSLEIIGYGFSDIKDAVKLYFTLKNELQYKPFFLSISEQNFEKYSHITFPEQDWFVWAVYYDDPEENSKSISAVRDIASKLNGIDVDKTYLKEKWRDIGEAEIGIGRSCRNLLFQEYWIPDQNLTDFIDEYVKKSKKYEFLTAIYTIGGVKGWSRIKVFGLTDISNSREFFAIKAFLHELSVKVFSQGDRVYTVGVVNTFYFLKYRPKEIEKRKALKDKLDPENLFNSYRIVESKMKFWRISLMFTTAKFLYKIFH